MRIVASPGVVAVEERAHHSPALVVPAGALSAGAGQASARGAAGCAIFLVLVRWASAGGAGTFLGNVAYAFAGAADGIRRGELAACTAAVIGVIADRAILELARLSITAVVTSAAVCAAAVAFFAFLDNAVAALTTSDSHDATVIRKTVRHDAVAAEGRANVADGAGRECGHIWLGVWIHDVLSVRIAGCCAQWAALGRSLQVLRTRLAVAVMHGTERVP